MNILSALPVVCLIVALPYCEPVDGVILLHCRRKDADRQPQNEHISELECDIHGVTIRKPNKYEFKVSCPHQNLFDKVKQFVFQRSTVEFLPKSLFNTMRYVEKAEVRGVQLEYIHPEAFHYAKHLHYLDLSHNLLRQIGEELVGAGNLVYLDISHNQIAFIHAKAFREMERLKILILESNVLTTFSSNGHDFHELDLQLNYLNLVCANATILNLSSNRIKTFTTCKSSVSELKLSNNLLSSFNVFQLTNLHGLKSLDISKNALRELYFHQLPYSLHLQHLNLSQCQLQDITFNNLYHLRTLDLSYNPKIDPSILRPLKYLQEIHIKGMKLTIEDFVILRNNLRSLKSLHILSDWSCEYLDQIVDVFCKTNVTVNFGKSCTDDVVIDIENSQVPRHRYAYAEQAWFYVLLLFGITLSGSLSYVVFKKYCIPRLQYY